MSKIKVGKSEMEEGKTYWMVVNAFSRAHPYVEHTPKHRVAGSYIGPVKFIEYEKRNGWNNKNCHVVFPMRIEGLTYNVTKLDDNGSWVVNLNEHSAYLTEKDFEVYEV